MAELTTIRPDSVSNPDVGLPQLAAILPPPMPEITTAELERIGGAREPAAGELRPIRRSDVSLRRRPPVAFLRDRGGCALGGGRGS